MHGDSRYCKNVSSEGTSNNCNHLRDYTHQHTTFVILCETNVSVLIEISCLNFDILSDYF